jgi:hypothetical protein
MSVASRAAKAISKATEPSAADDFKMAKKLNRQIKAAQDADRKAESTSAGRATKQKVYEAEAAFDAWEAGYRKRLEERMKDYNKNAEVAPKTSDEKTTDLAKGGMVTKSRSNNLNKFYGK